MYRPSRGDEHSMFTLNIFYFCWFYMEQNSTPTSNLYFDRLLELYVSFVNLLLEMAKLGSISAALSCLVYPRGRSAGSFPEQRLVIEPSITQVTYKFTDKTLLVQVTIGGLNSCRLSCCSSLGLTNTGWTVTFNLELRLFSSC